MHWNDVMSRSLDLHSNFTLHTNRDLYLFVTGLAKAAERPERSLEDYLRALWRLGAERRELDAVPPAAFAGMLEAALREPPPPFDPRWADVYDDSPEDRTGFSRWEATILAQVVDLHELAQTGKLEDEFRYFGISAPRGDTWYNFDPLTFLECAACGSFGGWSEGDPGGRGYVPGPCAVLDDEGHLTVADPRELEPRFAALEPISWEDFAGFLRSGQWYE
jgi:hypothetical protein